MDDHQESERDADGAPFGRRLSRIRRSDTVSDAEVLPSIEVSAPSSEAAAGAPSTDDAAAPASDKSKPLPGAPSASVLRAQERRAAKAKKAEAAALASDETAGDAGGADAPAPSEPDPSSRRREAAPSSSDDDFISQSTIGELMYGARVSMGKMQLADVERELRIKAKFLAAIERIDVPNLPSNAYLMSFVRSYARYLEPALPMSSDAAVEKFAKEYEEKAGHPPPAAMEKRKIAEAAAAAEAARTGPVDGSDLAGRVRQMRARASESPAAGPVGPAPRPIPKDLFKNRGGAQRRATVAPEYPAASYPSSRRSGAVGGLLFAGVAIGIVGALAYGAWSIVKTAEPRGTQTATNFERRDVLSTADDVRRPSASAYEDDGVLTQIYEPPPVERADGPIAQLDPATSSLFSDADDAPAAGEAAPSDTPPLVTPPVALETETAAVDATGPSAVMPPPTTIGALPSSVIEVVETLGDTAPAAAELSDQPAFALRAIAPVWVRIENALQSTVFTGNMAPGAMQDLPVDQGPLRLRTGNAGGSVIVVRGVAYGPLGESGFVRTVTLTREEVVATLPQMPQVTEQIAREYAARLAAEAEDGGAVQ